MLESVDERYDEKRRKSCPAMPFKSCHVVSCFVDSVHRKLFRLPKLANAFVPGDPGAFEGRSTKAVDGLGMNDGNESLQF